MLTIFQSPFQDLNLLQTSWAKDLNPLLANPLNGVNVLKNVLLSSTGTNYVDHKLGRKLQGWFLVRKRGPAEIYDMQDTNSQANLTLALISDTNVSVDIGVF